MSGSLTIADVLAVKYLGKWKWSPDGKKMAFIWDDGGLNDLWSVEALPGKLMQHPQTGESGPRKLTSAKDGVSSFEWTKDGGIFCIVDGSLVEIKPEPGSGSIEAKTLVSGKQMGGLSLAKDGVHLAFGMSGSIWVLGIASMRLAELEVPGKIEPVGESGNYAEWSPSGERFAFAFRDDDNYNQVGVAKVSDAGVSLEWRSHFERPALDLSWLDDDTLLFTQATVSGMTADIKTMRIPAPNAVAAPEILLHVEGTGKGPVMFASGSVSPDGKMLQLLLENDGWAHHYLLDFATKGLKQVTFGQCEDFAHAGDSAVWLSDGSGFLYASNRNAADQRHIFRYSIETGQSVEVIGLPGTNSKAAISSDGRLAFQHCDEFRNMDIWVAGPNGEEPRQVTSSMPPAWTAENQFESTQVSYDSAGGLSIHGYLSKPKGIPAGDGKRYPAIVWVHGGPIRQMRKGWNPLHSYALFHAYNQYLVGQGYVVLSVNYRGGTGYGRDFRQALYHKMGVDDVADVIGAGNYLKSLPYVDPERVAVYGLSYGGYMTLHCLTQYPDVFKCGINIAGIWDFVQWTKWADKRYGKRTGLFKAFFGGEPEESLELYRIGSPKTYVETMKEPLMNVHGTADMNVDFQQLDSIIEDLVEHGKDFEVAYYPKEVHTFAKRKSWMDAMPKMTAFFDKNLKS